MSDTQITEVLGRNRLIDELLRAGLEVAEPVRDRGIDLLAYADLGSAVDAFAARPIQMKAATKQSFSLDRKYAKFPGLLIAYVWNLEDPTVTLTYAMTFEEALGIADAMGYAETDSWKVKGYYATNRPSARLIGLLEPYRMTSEKWWKRVVVGG